MNKKEEFFEMIRKNKLSRFHKAAMFHFENVYESIDFKGKRVLDIGAGNGLHSFFASSCGAQKVVSIEPEADGSQGGYLEKFKNTQKLLGLKNVSLFAGTLQDFDARGDTFDVIISHYSINHLDENACMNLLKNSEAQKKYLEIFKKIYQLSAQDAKLIFADCSGENIFNELGIKNIFSPTIEWNKHQSPKVWIKLLEKSGFINSYVKWIAPDVFGYCGKLFLNNKLGGFLTHSHYCIFTNRNVDGH